MTDQKPTVVQQLLGALPRIPRIRVFCHPDDYANIAAAVAGELLAVTIQTNPVVPAGQLYVLNSNPFAKTAELPIGLIP
ncbi:FliH/SctL family protein [Planotetraspora mira]|uniref:Uncharacterized protein n=1 Tax=Planotetraspora mira TaxID=58121 RepID=A0A8J3XBA6_9ACTN|nr:hypothetical protein [Planotetraspora mira]GII34386.1 hypothetical protein Pmi06nite_78280 [Planotetraspora mira]